MHRQEPAQEHQVQVQGERAPALFAVEAGDVPLLIFSFWASETWLGTGFRRGGCRGPQRTYDSSVLQDLVSRRGVGTTYQHE